MMMRPVLILPIVAGLLLGSAAGAVESPPPIAADIFTDTFVAVETPSLPASVAAGQPLFSVAVDYLHTGVLTTTVRTGLLGIGRPVPAGTPVFGLPNSAATGVPPSPKLLWCAAVVSDKPPVEGAAAGEPWAVTCFPQMHLLGLHSVKFAPLGADYFPHDFDVRNASVATDVAIEIKPVALHPPLRVVYAFAGWDHGEANLRVLVRTPDRWDPLHLVKRTDDLYDRLHLKLDADGVAHLRVLGGEVLLRRSPDGQAALAELARPFATHTLADPDR